MIDYEKRLKVKTILVKKYCKCGGEMLPNWYVLSSYPLQYSPTCNKCGNIIAYWDKYPKIEYEGI